MSRSPTLLIAIALLAACSSNETAGPQAPQGEGVLDITAARHGTGPHDMYRVVVDGTPLERAIAPGGHLQLTLPAGAPEVRLTGLPAHCSTGQAAYEVVVASEPVALTIPVTCTGAAVRVRTRGVLFDQPQVVTEAQAILASTEID